MRRSLAERKTVMGHDYAMTLEEIAAVLGMTYQRVYQVQKSAMEKIRARFGDATYYELFPEEGRELVQ